MAAAVSEAFRALLDSEDNSYAAEEENGELTTLESRQAKLCFDLCQNLAGSSHQKNSLREVFQASPASLTPILSNLLNHRVETEALLPATQDVQANEDVLADKINAMTLTMPCLQAAQLYARLLSMPGALGSQLVDLELLTALTAIVRRWTVECCGREDLVTNNHTSNSLGGSGKGGAKSPTKSPPKKRSRRRHPSLVAEAQGDDDDVIGECGGAGEASILQAGLQVTLAICLIPRQREFESWSADARESILEALSCALGTTAALQYTAGATEAAESMAQVLESTKQQETAVVVLRGLLHYLRLQQALPNGERGKFEAHTAASKALQDILQRLSRTAPALSDMSNKTPKKSKIFGKPPSKTPGGKTPKSQRKRRVSSEYGMTPMTSPALKGRRQSGILSPPMQPNKPRGVWCVVLGLLQKLVTSTGLERACTRAPTVETLEKCVQTLPLAERAHFLRFLYKLTSSKVSLHRLVASELIGTILAQDWLQAHAQDAVDIPSTNASTSTDSPSTTTSGLCLPIALWRALQGRLVDKLAAVRARAAASVETAVRAHPEWLEESILGMLKKRALKDETATVRKTAILAMTQVLLQNKDWMAESHVAVICELCQDSSLLTRKAAAESLTLLLQTYKRHALEGALEEAWQKHILPMVLDEGSGSKAIQSLGHVIVDPILNLHGDDVAWRILAHVAQGPKGASQALKAGLKQLAQDEPGKIHEQLLGRVAQVAQQTLHDMESSEAQVVGVWCLLEALLTIPKTSMLRLNTTFCVDAWKIMLERQSPWLYGALKSCLVVVSKLAAGLEEEAARDCRQSLQRELERFSFSSDVAGAAISALCALSAESVPNVRTHCSIWIRAILERCKKEITYFVQFVTRDDMADIHNISSERRQRLVRALFTVGELSMIGFRPEDDDRDKSRQVNNHDNDKLRGLHEKPTKRLQDLVQALLAGYLPGPREVSNPSSIRAHAFAVLGKLCLRDENLAKNSLYLLARELHPSVKNPCISVQSNALLVFGDLCVRYTNMTDRYLPVMASCLQTGTTDPETNLMAPMKNNSAIVRKHAVLLLSSLLLQDYIKWRGLLFHRFLVACSDEDDEVAQLAESVLSGPLWVRNPKLFFNHSVEALFVLNKSTAHPIYIAAASQGDGGSGIAVGFEGIYLNGAVGQARRRRMYDFLLSKLSDEEKIGVTARLAKEVLGGAVSREGDLGRVCEISASLDQLEPKLMSALNVMSDCFYILTSKGIKVGKVQEGGDDHEVDDPNILPNPNRQVTVAKSRLLSKISRKHLIEIVLPILCNLKIKLQSSCSPLLKDLMNYLLEIFRNYKLEVKEFLANDPTLLQEIEYDARQFGAANQSE